MGSMKKTSDTPRARSDPQKGATFRQQLSISLSQEQDEKKKEVVRLYVCFHVSRRACHPLANFSLADVAVTRGVII